MAKYLLFLSFISLSFLTVGTAYQPNDTVFWLASNATTYQIVRGLLCVLILVQLTTNPPRKVWFRLLSGLTAMGVFCWSVAATNSFNMSIMDTLAFVAASLAVGVTALEHGASSKVSKTSMNSNHVYTLHPERLVEI